MAKKRAETVRIPRSEYEALLGFRARLQAFEFGYPIPANPGHGGSSPIDADPELSAFIRERLGRYKQSDIADLCRVQFGAVRAPSKSAIHRFWMRLNGLRTPIKRRLRPAA